VNRTQLQDLAEERTRDAEALLVAAQWSGAYYLAGYAVECGLKACIAKLTNQDDYPDKGLALKCYTHNIETLIKVAGLELLRKMDATVNPVRGSNWLIVKDWDENARYQHWTEPQARKMVSAVGDTTNGVLSWIKAHW
jgi:HEPN domain-containing protein